MQDIHSVAGERIFGDEGGGGGERRLRPHHHQNHPNNQSLKCPRCDSSNTKFCYYNNYNLSQPRHFCKGCRRYWTKGGVLRNVPVGGGCRKTKRSKPKSSQSSESVPTPAVERKSSSNSSSESSSLTATTTTAAAAAETVSATSSRSPTGLLNIHEYKSAMSHGINPSHGFDREILEQSTDCGFFSVIGNFTSLITSSSDQLSFRFDSWLDPPNQWHQPPPEVAGSGAMCSEQEMKIQPEVPAAEGPFLDEDVQVKLSPSCNGIFPQSDWQPSIDQGLFDLPSAVDHAYWSQTNTWTDPDQPSSLFIP